MRGSSQPIMTDVFVGHLERKPGSDMFNLGFYSDSENRPRREIIQFLCHHLAMHPLGVPLLKDGNRFLEINNRTD